MKDFVIEIFMWWADWLVDGEAYDMAWRLFLTALFIGFVGLAIWMTFWGKGVISLN